MSGGFDKLRRAADGASGLFLTRGDGGGEIISTADGKIRFAEYAGTTFCSIISSCGQRSVYPLEEVGFDAPAEYVAMDLDGTSINSEEFWIEIIRKTASRILGREICFSEEDIPYVSGHTTQEHLDYALGKYGYGFRPEATEVYHSVSRSELALALERGDERFRPMPGLKDFLSEMKARGIKAGLASSGLFYKAIPEIESAFSAMGMGSPKDFYDGIIMGGVEKEKGRYSSLGELVAKPHPWIYKELIYVGLKCPDNRKAIVVEDSASGVLAARLAGYPVVGLTTGNVAASGFDCLCCRMADNLTEAKKYIFGE